MIHLMDKDKKHIGQRTWRSWKPKEIWKVSKARLPNLRPVHISHTSQWVHAKQCRHFDYDGTRQCSCCCYSFTLVRQSSLSTEDSESAQV